MEQLRSANWALASWAALGAYVLGCFATGYYLVRCWTGQDLRELGSRSLGARNVGRVLGWPGFALTLLGDFGKGAFAVWATSRFTHDPSILALAMLGVVTGHIWPAQLRFQGGKGVATSLGALAVYDFRVAGAFVLLFAIASAVVRKTVLPAMFAYTCLPVVCYWLARETGNAAQSAVVAFILSSLILVAHRKNMIDEVLRIVERRNLRAKSHRPSL